MKCLKATQGAMTVILMYLCINPKMSPIRDPEGSIKNEPIDWLHYTKNSKLSPTCEVLFTNGPDEIVNTKIFSYFSN